MRLCGVREEFVGAWRMDVATVHWGVKEGLCGRWKWVTCAGLYAPMDAGVCQAIWRENVQHIRLVNNPASQLFKYRLDGLVFCEAAGRLDSLIGYRSTAS
jgi:hypothetical protein